MAFEWLPFLQQHNIPHTTRATNLTRGNYGISCPFCAWSDSSPEHWRMGISPDGRGWNCWSNAEHSGVRPHRLVQALLRCSWADALAIVGSADKLAPGVADANFGDIIGEMLYASQNTFSPPARLSFPDSIPPITAKGGAAYNMCCRFLLKRGYQTKDIQPLIARFDLRVPTSGPFGYRVVFPIIHPEGLVCWQGRTMVNHDLRYKSLSADPAKAKLEQMPVATRSPHQALFDAKTLYEAPERTLVVCEGPFDAMRLSYYGLAYGVRATCLFGKSMSVEQAELLADIAPLYKRRVFMLDADALIDSIKLRDRLGFLGFEALGLPSGIKDPGDLSPEEIGQLFQNPNDLGLKRLPLRRR